MSNIIISPESGILEFNNNSPSGAAIGSATAPIRLDATGGNSFITGSNFGIGTTNPTNNLHVKGTMQLDNSVSDAFKIRINGGVGLALDHNSIKSTNAGTDITLSAGKDLIFQTYDGGFNDAVIIDTAGDVGIGTTNPTVALDVVGAGKFTGQVTIPATPSASTDAASKGYVDAQVGSADTLQEVTDNGNTTTNSVGIGTTSVAGAKLEIQTTAGSAMLQLRPTAASTDINPLILYRSQNNGTANYLLAKNASTYFGTYNSGVPTDESEMVKICLLYTSPSPRD